MFEYFVEMDCIDGNYLEFYIVAEDDTDAATQVMCQLEEHEGGYADVTLFNDIDEDSCNNDYEHSFDVEL